MTARRMLTKADLVEHMATHLYWYYDENFPLSSVGSDVTEFFNKENRWGQYTYLLDEYVKDTSVAPILVFEDGHVVDGWHRIGAAQIAGLTHVAAWVSPGIDMKGKPLSESIRKRVVARMAR